MKGGERRKEEGVFQVVQSACYLFNQRRLDRPGIGVLIAEGLIEAFVLRWMDKVACWENRGDTKSTKAVLWKLQGDGNGQKHCLSSQVSWKVNKDLSAGFQEALDLPKQFPEGLQTFWIEKNNVWNASRKAEVLQDALCRMKPC